LCYYSEETNSGHGLLANESVPLSCAKKIGSFAVDKGRAKMKWLAIFFIKIYRNVISPIKPPSCRFYPTCSEYGLVAFQRFGFLKGFWLTFKRILKCHPFHPGGYDPVPEKEK